MGWAGRGGGHSATDCDSNRLVQDEYMQALVRIVIILSVCSILPFS